MSALALRRNPVAWLLPVCTILGALLLFSFGSADVAVILYVCAIAIVGLILLSDAIVSRRRQPVWALIFFLAVSAAILKNYSAVRDDCRWLVWSHSYKPRVLAQRDSVANEFKHVEWDGWGFPGAGDTTVYLVFDPTDALSSAARGHLSGKFPGLPCEVDVVHRLESHWYAVRFYTDDQWGQRAAFDCTGHSPGSAAAR
jgi:hypothetical protein